MHDNEYMSEYVKNRYIRMKLDAIKYKGGKCTKCGYDKCHAAMQFHHRDPSQKEFDWSYLRKRSVEAIRLELDKCDLVCCRCHVEIHFDENKTRKALSYIDEKRQAKKVRENNKICVQCNEPFVLKRGDKNTKKFCSMKCVHKSQEVTNWPTIDELKALVDSIGYVKVSQQFGVSPRTVKDRLDRMTP